MADVPCRRAHRGACEGLGRLPLPRRSGSRKDVDKPTCFAGKVTANNTAVGASSHQDDLIALVAPFYDAALFNGGAGPEGDSRRSARCARSHPAQHCSEGRIQEGQRLPVDR